MPKHSHIALAIILVLLLGLVPSGTADAHRRQHRRGLDPAKAFSQFVQTSWTIDDGLAQNTVDALIQTRDGFMWIGTFGGLSRFDGVRFVNFDRARSPMLKHNHVAALAEDAQGNLWIGTNGGGLVKFSDTGYVNYTTDNGLTNNFIRSIVVDRRDRIIVGMERGGIVRLDPDARDTRKQFVPFENSNALIDNNVRAVVVDRKGNLWAATGTRLAEVTSDGVVSFTKSDGLPDNSIESLAIDSTGALWVGTSNGLARYRDGKFTSYTTKDGLSATYIRSLYVDSRNNLWIATDGGGLNHVNLNAPAIRFRAYTKKDGLLNDYIRVIYEDREGSLWIGTRAGIDKVNDGKFTVYTMDEGLADDFVRTVMEDRSGRMWIGTNGAGLDILDRGAITHYSHANGLSNEFIRALLEDNKGTIWIGTDGGGLFKFLPNGPSSKKFSNLTMKNGLAENYVRSIVEDKAGSVWIGTYGGGISKMVGNTFVNYTTKDGLCQNLVFSLLVANDSTLWIGTNGGGISRFRDGHFETLTTHDGLANNFVFTMYEDSKGAVWIGTNGGGISRYRNGVLTSYSTSEGLYDDVILSILEDSHGNLWFGCDRGIFRVDKGEFDMFDRKLIRSIPCTAFGKRDGLKNSEVSGVSQPTAWRSRDGKLWFPTLKGVATIDPNNIGINPEPPPVIVEAVVADSTAIPGSRKVEFSPGKRKFEFRYTALSFLAPEKMQFRYKLEGFDREWVDAGNRRVAYYTNIPPGEYTFRVIASNNDGIWNNVGASFEFFLEPFFYQRTIFYVILAFGLMLLGAGAYAIRVRFLRRKARTLERVVEERTQDLVCEKTKTEEALRATERAKEELAGANVALDAANKEKSELLSIVAHDLKNKLVAIRTLAHSLKSERADQATTQEWYDAIFDSSNHMLALIKDLLDSTAIETGRLHLNKKRVDLTRTAELVVLSYRDQAKRKGQSIALQSAPRGVCLVEADERWLKDAMENLVSNAVKFSHPDSVIQIRVRREEESVRFEVQDHGPGLNEEDKRMLFGRFHRLSARPTGGEVSTGLGLAIVKKAVEMHNGRVWAESELGKGTTFIVELPGLPLEVPAS